MVGQNSIIQSRNMIDCLGFFMRHPRFLQNPIYQPLYIYNQNEDQVYNEIYTEN